MKAFGLLLFLLPLLAYASYCDPPSNETTRNQPWMDEALEAHNFIRAQHESQPLRWNETLAFSAFDWARECRYRHSRTVSGENIGVGFPNFTSAVMAWASGRVGYNFKRPRFAYNTYKFTQVVWKSTEAVGCYQYDCGRDVWFGDNPNRTDSKAIGLYYVCQYFPPGNILGNGYFADNVKAFKAKSNAGLGASQSTHRTWPGVIIALSIVCGTFFLA